MTVKSGSIFLESTPNGRIFSRIVVFKKGSFVEFPETSRARGGPLMTVRSGFSFF